MAGFHKIKPDWLLGLVWPPLGHRHRETIPLSGHTIGPLSPVRAGGLVDNSEVENLRRAPKFQIWAGTSMEDPQKHLSGSVHPID